MMLAITPTKPIRRHSRRYLSSYNGNADPGRRLITAMVNQALEDFLYPPDWLSPDDRQSASQFLQSREGVDILRSLGISINAIKRVIQ